MLLDECINFLATLRIMANLNKMAVMTKMNASPPTRVISIDVALHNATHLGGSLQILQTKMDPRGGGPSIGNDSFVMPSNSVSLFEEV